MYIFIYTYVYIYIQYIPMYIYIYISIKHDDVPFQMVFNSGCNCLDFLFMIFSSSINHQENHRQTSSHSSLYEPIPLTSNKVMFLVHPHKNLLGNHCVSNPSTRNQRISTPAHLLWCKSKIALCLESVVQINPKLFMGSKSHYKNNPSSEEVCYSILSRTHFLHLMMIERMN